jgi:hypothetical protein
MDNEKQVEFKGLSAFILSAVMDDLTGGMPHYIPEDHPTTEDFNKVFDLIPKHKRDYWKSRYCNLSGKDQFDFLLTGYRYWNKQKRLNERR